MNTRNTLIIAVFVVITALLWVASIPVKWAVWQLFLPIVIFGLLSGAGMERIFSKRAPLRALITRRHDDITAHFVGRPEFGCGSSSLEALGDLIYGRSKTSGIEVSWNTEDDRTRRYVKEHSLT